MTLFKQIAAIFAFSLLIILGTVMWLNFKTANDFVQGQLLSTAEDTATSLGLSLSPVADYDDTSTMETMINAIFDRGYYESITLIDLDGNVLLEKKQPVVVKDIPAWFIDFIALQTPLATTQISTGWTMFGELSVRAHPGHAYMQLWQTLIEIGKSFAMLSVAILALLYFLLKIILRALVRVEEQALAINENDFIVQDKIPFTTEFKNVVIAMNSMIVKVKEIFDKEAESLRKYHEVLYTDGVTKLYNRRYLLIKLSNYQNAHSEVSQGSFMMLSFNGIDEAKKILGFVKLEELLKNIASILKTETQTLHDSVVARMNNSDFAILIPSYGINDTKENFKFILDKTVESFNKSELDSNVSYISIGAVGYTPDDTTKTLFSKADFTLASAKVKRGHAIEYGKSDESSLVLGKEEWVKMISASMDENMLKVAVQPVVTIDDDSEIYHDEVYLRLVDEKDKIYNAGYFMPMLINLNLTDDVDRHVVELAMHHLKKMKEIKSLAINIAASFISNASNMHWLREKLYSFSSESNVILCFESSNFAILKNLDIFTELAKMVQARGYKFGIDNFSSDSSDMSYLQKIKPNYIKADKSYLIDLQYSDDGGMSNEALFILTKSLNIDIIATAVETQDQKEKLKKMEILYFQGSLVAEPKILGM